MCRRADKLTDDKNRVSVFSRRVYWIEWSFVD